VDDIPSADEIYEMVDDLHNQPQTVDEQILFLYKGEIYRLTITRDDD